MKVRAIKQGFYDDDLKQPGDVFEVKDGSKAKWFVPASDDDVAQADAGNVRGGGSRRQSATKPSGGSGAGSQ